MVNKTCTYFISVIDHFRRGEIMITRGKFHYNLRENWYLSTDDPAHGFGCLTSL